VVVMVCDAPGCLRQVRRAPRIVIHSTTPLAPGHRPFKVMTPLHYCDQHFTCFDPREWLNDANKRRVEAALKRIRPPDFLPDFERPVTEPVLVTTPEYLAFMQAALGSNVHVVA
jgi:hypothetical protein